MARVKVKAKLSTDFTIASEAAEVRMNIPCYAEPQIGVSCTRSACPHVPRTIYISQPYSLTATAALSAASSHLRRKNSHGSYSPTCPSRSPGGSGPGCRDSSARHTPDAAPEARRRRLAPSPNWRLYKRNTRGR